MKKFAFTLFALLTVLTMTSCISSTKPFVDDFYKDPSLSVEEKLEASGSRKLMLSEPEAYFDADIFRERYLELIEGAEDYILISTFLGSDCDGLNELYQTIARKAREGLRVYMIMDGTSSYDMTDTRYVMTPIYFLKDSGVHLIEYNPLSFLRAVNPKALIDRDHRKLVVVDGEYTCIGGMNMNYISLGAEGAALQRDSMYIFKSADFSKALTDQFVNIWNEISVEKLERSSFATIEDADTSRNTLTGYLFNQGPGSDQSMSAMFSALINSAREEIYMLPYLPLLDGNMMASFQSAIDRGVHIKMVIPLDMRGYTRKGTAFFFDKLVEMGVEIWYEKTGPTVPMLHQKLMVVDGRYTMVGSPNFNMRSMRLSYEIALVIDSEEFAAKALEQGKEREANMTYMDMDYAIESKKREGSFFCFLATYFGG
ncbi:MAG: phosphatidylserine/phosphatidylglycerophosphate/cardiolipin synthase family protein [Spirochaetales bacterium]|nr:phosphatidylserine/phosphatidylglycerophosphate/cardiolipin synthase family protein [Spirochaetales bacterium]